MTGLPSVTPGDVLGLFPGAPKVTDAQLRAAADWAEGEIELAAVAVPPPGTRQFRELRRAIASYALSNLPLSANLAHSLNTRRVSLLKDGDFEVKFQEIGSNEIAETSAGWLSAAYRHLQAAGVPMAAVSAGASR